MAHLQSWYITYLALYTHTALSVYMNVRNLVAGYICRRLLCGHRIHRRAAALLLYDICQRGHRKSLKIAAICRCIDKSDVISRFRRICSLSIEVSWVTKWLSSCRGRRREVWKVTYADKGRIALMLAVQFLITCSQLRWPAILVVRRGSSFSLDAKSSAVEEAASHPSQQSLGSASHPHWYPDLEL